jgi:SagB-type dehydrogenase family enzyme
MRVMMGSLTAGEWRRKYPGVGLGEGYETSLSELFHENTKLSRLSGREYARHLDRIKRNREVMRTLSSPYKIYSLSGGISLGTAPAADSDLEQAIEARRSVRRFTRGPLAASEMGRLLWFSYGRPGQGQHRRPVPSPGALYPLELYLIALNVDGLPRGTYHYSALTHAIGRVSPRDPAQGGLAPFWLHDIDAEGIAAVIVICAVFRRCTVKYLDRGYRMLLMEVGAVMQNMSLLAADLGLGTCAIGGFLDDDVAKIVGVDGVAEAPLLAVVVGRPADEAAPETATGMSVE